MDAQILIVGLLAAVINLFALYWVIRKAVTAGIQDHVLHTKVETRRDGAKSKRSGSFFQDE
jgi:hypothetical protein